MISSHFSLFHHRHVCYPIVFELHGSGTAYNLEYQIFPCVLFPSALCHPCVIGRVVEKQGVWAGASSGSTKNCFYVTPFMVSAFTQKTGKAAMLLPGQSAESS